jgi:S-adenosylmethionine synthetase
LRGAGHENLVVLAGEFETGSTELYERIRGGAEGLARSVLRDIGYRDAQSGIDPDLL